MEILFQPWNNWMAMALLTPALWAIACVIDVCFVGENTYKSPFDGAIVSGFFCIIPILIILFQLSGWGLITALSVAMALIAGAVYFLHVLFYFKALFAMNDASHVEIFNSLSVLFVPLFAFVFLNERLVPMYYAAIFLAFIGVVILIRYNLSALVRKTVGLLLASVIFISIAMVIQSWVFKQMDYWNGALLFLVGNFSAAVLLACVKNARRVRVLTLCRRFWPIFALAESIEIAAILSSQRATDIGPSVSLVAVVECSLPAFIMLLSALLLKIPASWMRLSQGIRDSLMIQLSAFPAKLISMCFIGFAIVLL